MTTSSEGATAQAEPPLLEERALEVGVAMALPAIPLQALAQAGPWRRHFTYDETLACLYALCCGAAEDAATRPLALGTAPAPLPSLATLLAWDYRHILQGVTREELVLHGAHSFELHRDLPWHGRCASTLRIEEVTDKGPGRPAIITAAMAVHDAADGALLATLRWTSVARGAGGFGGQDRPATPPPDLPAHAPDVAATFRTMPGQPLFYRLLGDRNPLHAEPEAARRAGFPAPILHGMNTFGIACNALVQRLAAGDPRLVRAMSCSFTAPALPGDTLRTEAWRDGAAATFRVVAVERGDLPVAIGKIRLSA